MTKIKHVRTADCVLAGYRVHKSGPDAIGSLLLGLYDDGIAALGRRRRRLPDGAAARAVRRAAAAGDRRSRATRGTGRASTSPRGAAFGSRWNPGKSLSFVPLRPERVLEVRYDHMEGTRFRHPPQFVRWRPDREPASCDFEQLERPVDLDVAQILG